MFTARSVTCQSEGQLCCCDVRAVSHLSVVQDLRDVARDRSFKHVFLRVGVTQIRYDGVLYFRSAPSLESLWDIRGATPCYQYAKWRSVLQNRTLGMMR